MSQVERLDQFVERRNALARRYDQAFASQGIRGLSQSPDSYSSYHLYVIRVDSRRNSVTRAQVYDSLREQGIAANLHYIPVYRQPYYRRLGFAPGAWPEAELYYAEALTLPLYPDLGDSEQDQVIEAVAAALRR